MSLIGASSGNVANALCEARLIAVPGSLKRLKSLQLTFTGATVGSNKIATITGLLTGTLSFVVAVPSGVLALGQELILYWEPALYGDDVTDIVFSCPALWLGSTHACVNIQGTIN